MKKYNFFNDPKNKKIVRKLRANGDKVIHFLRFNKDYVLQTSKEMQIVAEICEPSQRKIMIVKAEKLEYYIPKLVRSYYKIVIG